MEAINPHWFFHNWQRKLLAIFGAIAIWLLVDQSITSQKTVSNVPVRLVNLPSDRTVEGLLPNGILAKRVTLTLFGTKDLVDSLESSDLEVVVDAANLPDESLVQVSKKNLVSLNPDIDLSRHVTSLSSSEFVVKLSKLITAKIPVTMGAPIGEAPDSYQFLDIWPQVLYHTLTGPEEQVRRLQDRGLQLVFDLSQITKAELDALPASQEAYRGDEVAFRVPDGWKKVYIPISGEISELINDPLASDLSITFLRKEFIPLSIPLPVRVFYPVNHSATINPNTYPLGRAGWISERNGIVLTTLPLMVTGVSHLFLDVVKNNIEIAIVAVPKSERETLQWGIEFVNLRDLEETFVNILMTEKTKEGVVDLKKKDARLRRHFREYVQTMRLLKTPDQRFLLECHLGDNVVTARDVTIE